MDLPSWLDDAFVAHGLGVDAPSLPAEKTARVVLGWSCASLACCLLFFGCYSALPSVRQTPGWQLLRSTVCELIESCLWLAISCTRRQYAHLIWPPLLACDIAANGLRLTMYVLTPCSSLPSSRVAALQTMRSRL